MATPNSGANGGGPAPQGGPFRAAVPANSLAVAIDAMFMAPSLARASYARHAPVRGFSGALLALHRLRRVDDDGHVRSV
ncbi:hypothetical protein F4561_000857 [Lipingzhangella halophila]|uniref:Uncharacterized protein n=1 Tax=Lipingzhangella halophila TaxID=1783352 RepID=A0A7W7RDK7_9ACTN|nr:hypothetical protein [Lipingzhangella halophila]MBB4930037.1 hypothetical protein [Lipingzhangella halophila]